MTRRTSLTSAHRPGLWAGFALLAFLASGCATTGKSLDDTVLAYVNGEPVTVQNLGESFESDHRGHSALLAGAGALREFLEPTIDRRLLIQEAHRIGLDQDPEVRRAVGALVTQRARDQLYKDEVSRPPEISEKAIQEAFQKMAERYRVRHILTYTREAAEQAVTRVRAGEAFGAVASQVSVSGTAGKGGDLGFVTWGNLDPRLESGVEVMRPGELRGPIETDQGWNVLLLEEKIQVPELPELAKVQGRIKMTLSQRAQSRRSYDFYEQLKAQWKVEVHSEALTEPNLLGDSTTGPDAEQAKQIPVARAGERTISLADLRSRLNPRALRGLPLPWALTQIRRILDEAIYGALLEQEALKREYDKRLEIVKEARKLEDMLLLNRLAGTVIYPRIQVSDTDIREFYDQNPKPFTEPEVVHIRAIVLDGEAEAQAVLDEVRAGGDFPTLARSRSKDPGTAQVAGDLGWVKRGTLDPTIETAAFSLKEGEVGLVKTERASFVLKVEERQPARLLEFTQVKEKAREMLLTRRQREELQRWVARLREASEIVVDEDAIKQAVATYEAQVKQKGAQDSKGDSEAKKGGHRPTQ
ncbi:MAG TPA: peptidylprolyl isomerase [Candidatus Methylomirabilis sp.]|nr:peptidylprolyl isomerase [Candidatus Methylomirabilis sp.]HSC70858.1 peptidylprolyl isomerase [Candidatus Methylomirabilis sp.]